MKAKYTAIVAVADKVDVHGVMFTEECLRNAAAKDPALTYDPERKLLYTSDIRLDLPVLRRRVVDLWDQLKGPAKWTRILAVGGKPNRSGLVLPPGVLQEMASRNPDLFYNPDKQVLYASVDYQG